MYYFSNMCCSCLTTTKEKLQNIKCLNRSLINFYNFFITKVYSVSELNTTMSFVCEDCLKKLEYCYEFWTQCIKSKNVLYSYIYDLKSKQTNNIEGDVKISLTDVKYIRKRKKSPTPESDNKNDDSPEKQLLNVDVKETIKEKDDLTIAVLADEEEDKFMKLVDNFSHLVDELEQYNRVDKMAIDLSKNEELPLCIAEDDNDDDDDDDEDEDAMQIDIPAEEDVINNDDNCDNTTQPQVVFETQNTKDGTQKHICHICVKEFPAAYHLHRHSLIHTESSSYRCPFCYKRFKYKKYVLIHENAYLKGKFKCTFCDKILCSPKNFLKHKRYHEKPPKPVKPVKPSRPPVIIKCTGCNATFTRRKCLQTHMKRKHGANIDIGVNGKPPKIMKVNKKSYLCLTCGKQYTDRCLLEKHEIKQPIFDGPVIKNEKAENNF